MDNRVGGTTYTPWELGHAQNTTNEEYRRKYQAIYEEDAAYETVYRLRVPAGQKPHITTLVPVRDSSGQVSSVLCIQRPASEFNEASLPYLKSVAVSTILLAPDRFLPGLRLFPPQPSMAPIRRVSDEATRFARENIKGEELGRISKFEELASLARSIDTMETDMASYIENLTAATAEGRIGAELSLASKIQENSIPTAFLPSWTGRISTSTASWTRPGRWGATSTTSSSSTTTIWPW